MPENATTASRQISDTSDRVMAWVFDAGILAAIALWVFAHFVSPTAQYPAGMALIVGLIARTALKAGHPDLSRWIFLLPWCLAFSLIPLFTNGIRSPLLATTPMLVLLSGWLFGRRLMWSLAVVLSLLVLGYALAESAGGWSPPVATLSPVVFAMILVPLAGLTALIVRTMLKGFESNVRRQVALQANLAESELLFRALLTSLHDGILVVNHDGKVEYANQQLCAMYSIDSPPESFVGFDSKSIMGKISQMYAEPDATVRRLQEIIRAGVPILGAELVLKNGRTLMRDFIPFEYGDGRRGRIWHMRDVTALRDAQTQLIEANRKLEALSITDSLTGLANRRHFDQVLLDEWSRGQRQGHSVALLLLDVDWFKNFNDLYGHQAGDVCLRSVATALQAKARRAGDLAARYGGEEFAMIVPEMDAEAALALADSIRMAVHEIAQAHAGSPIGKVTVSLGVAVMAPTPDTQPDALVLAADRALYRAKDLGRDRVVTAPMTRLETSPHQ